MVVDGSSAILARTGSNTLCTLVKVTLEDGNVVKTMPLARSYNQHDWEVSAGKLAASVFPNGINCYSSGCQVNLPPSQPNEEYRLKSFSKSPSTRDTFARFLETATFGILSEDLDGLAQGNGQGSAIANWIKTQMNLFIVDADDQSQGVLERKSQSQSEFNIMSVYTGHGTDVVFIAFS